MLRRLAANTVFNILTYVVRIALSLVLTPILIRNLGRGGYGIWILGSAFWVGGLLSILDLGIKGAVVRFVAASMEKRDYRMTSEVINAALFTFIAVGAIACAGLHVFRFYGLASVFKVPPDELPIARALLGVLAWQLLFDFPNIAISGTIEGLNRYDVLRILEIVQVLVFGCAAAILVTVHPSVVWLGWCLFTTTVVADLAGFFVVRRICPQWRLRTWPSWATTRQVVVMSGQLLGIRLNTLVYANMDKMIIGMLVSSTLLTDYDVVYRLYALVVVSLTFVSQLVVPLTASLDARGDAERMERLKFWATKTTVAICCPVAVTTMILAEPLLRFWVGPAFAHDAFAARLFIAYLVFWCLTPVSYNMLVGQGRIGRLLAVQVPTTALNLIVSFALAPRFGIVGVILGTLIGNTVGFCVFVPMFFGPALADVRRFARVVVVPYAWVGVAGVVLAAVLWIHAPQSLIETGAMWAAAVGFFWVLYVRFGTNEDEWVALNSYSGGLLTRMFGRRFASTASAA
jgi:O-antigen/teichoic acid export membrane protein